MTHNPLCVVSVNGKEENENKKKTTTLHYKRFLNTSILDQLSRYPLRLTVFPPSSFFSLPHCKTKFISPCLQHVDIENILGWNSNDSYIHRLSLRSVFVFKLQFSPNRVYKPCLGRGDLSLSYSPDYETLGSRILRRRSWHIGVPFCGKC